MTRCTHDPAQLSAYLDGELEAAERLAIEDRVSNCPDCRELLADLETGDEALRRIEAPQPSLEAWAAFDRKLFERLGVPAAAASAATATATPPPHVHPTPGRRRSNGRGPVFSLLFRLAPVAAAASLLAAFVAHDPAPDAPFRATLRRAGDTTVVIEPGLPTAIHGKGGPPLFSGKAGPPDEHLSVHFVSKAGKAAPATSLGVSLDHVVVGNDVRFDAFKGGQPQPAFGAALAVTASCGWFDAGQAPSFEQVIASTEAAVTRLVHMPARPEEIAEYGKCLSESGLRDRVVEAAARAAQEPERVATLRRIEVLLVRLEHLDANADPEEIELLQESVRANGILDQVRGARATFTLTATPPPAAQPSAR
ncbi:MAG: zf-HC2 domain-containing protein [Planctomycetes bacterium]|nr:zf-HC2 domain-containing protein [Planctomycetota bacterium]